MLTRCAFQKHTVTEPLIKERSQRSFSSLLTKIHTTIKKKEKGKLPSLLESLSKIAAAAAGNNCPGNEGRCDAGCTAKEACQGISVAS